MSVSMATGQKFVELDGDSLEIDDAIKISKRECCVKVTCINASSNVQRHSYFYTIICFRVYSCLKMLRKRSKPQEKLWTMLSRTVQVY